MTWNGSPTPLLPYRPRSPVWLPLPYKTNCLGPPDRRKGRNLLPPKLGVLLFCQPVGYSHLQDPGTQGPDPSQVPRHLRMGPRPPYMGNMASPFSGAPLLNPPANLGCPLPYSVHTGTLAGSNSGVSQPTAPTALFSPAHFRLPL